MTELELIHRSVEKHPDDPQVYRDALAILYDGIQGGRAELHAENRELRKKIGAAMRKGVKGTELLDCRTQIYYRKKRSKDKIFRNAE